MAGDKEGRRIEALTATGGIEYYDLDKHEFTDKDGTRSKRDNEEAWKESLYKAIEERNPPTADRPYSHFYRHSQVSSEPPPPKRIPPPDVHGGAEFPLVRVGRWFRSWFGGQMDPVSKPMWEYKLVDQPRGLPRAGLESFLNGHGAGGWEMAGIDYGCFIFKRFVGGNDAAD